MIRPLLLLPLTLFAFAACSSSTEGTPGGDGAVGDDGETVTDGQTGNDGSTEVEHPVIPCGGTVFQCADGIDNDGDGLIDSDDPNCLGPCDNNEGGYYPDLPGGIGGAGGCTFDCYFDEDSGSGGDDCLWDVRCDSANPGGDWGGSSCAYDEDFTGIDCDAHFSDQFGTRTGCEENCEWRTPNGCDCFGCCLFPTSSDPNRYLFIGSREPGTTNQFGCTYEEATNPEGTELCATCTPVESCLKGCARCELCLGKTELPADCTPDDIDDRCEGGLQACGLEGEDPCPAGFYCLTGCCVEFGGPG